MSRIVAVVICNWNKKKEVLKCVRSVKESSYKSLDIVVVDNASTDNSVEALSNEFGNEITILTNSENKGGAGGFNTGVQYAIDKGYKYIHLLDNDAFVNYDTIENLINIIENEQDIGAVGSKLLNYNNPRYLQELGANIDFTNFNISPQYKGFIDNDELPSLVESDYVPACSVMIRSEAVRSTGLMDSDYFIYWDDIDWFFRMKKHGYRVVASSQATVRHKMGAAEKNDTFSTYYFWRNRIFFFLNSLKKDDIPLFTENIFCEIYKAVFMCNFNKQFNVGKTILQAVEDALMGVRGIAPDNRIYPREKVCKDLKINIFDCDVLVADCSIETLQKRLSEFPKEKNVILLPQKLDRIEIQKHFPHYLIVDNIPINGTIGLITNHILDLKGFRSEVSLYIDGYGNIVSGEEDKKFIKSYSRFLEEVYKNHFPSFHRKIQHFLVNRR